MILHSKYYEKKMLNPGKLDMVRSEKAKLLKYHMHKDQYWKRFTDPISLMPKLVVQGRRV